MAIDKPSLNDFLPNGFETQDKDGYKVNFDADKISAGYDKDTLEILSGPNLNNLLDNVGKNTHVLEQFLTFFRDMPIGSFPITNASNQLDYKSVNSFFRNVGELVFSAIPLEDENLRLLDGSLLEYTMTYSRFITYISGLRASLPNLFCTEQEFNQSVATYGVCGKFVYDTVTKSLRLPKISGFIKGTLDSSSLGDIDEAKAPNITAKGFMGESYSSGEYQAFANQASGALYYTGASGDTDTTLYYGSKSGIDADDRTGVFDASRVSSVYKNGATTIEPQAIKEFIYMVVSIDEAEKQVLSAVYNYKGSVATYEELPTAVAIGEVYNVIGEDPEGYSGANFAWTGEEWDRLGGTVNLSGYLTKTEAQNTYATKASLESNVDYLQGQINTNASNIVNIASQEVIDAGIQKIEMLKFASTLGAGKVTDTDLYSVIKKYKYSSFDRSKFTVVGTPNITKDGIASGFTQTSFIKKNISITGKRIVSKGKMIYKDSSHEQIVNFLGGTKGAGVVTNIRFSIFTNKNISFVANINNSDVALGGKGLSFVLNDGDTFEWEMIIDQTQQQFKYKINGVSGETTPSTRDLSTYNIVCESFALGNYSTSYNYSVAGSIDLKQFSITVDGVPVFSGNKTGIDTIKPSDYTVVGAPIITADGIIQSPTTTSNHITTDFSYDISKDFEYSFSAYITAAQSGLGDQWLAGLFTNSVYASLRFNGIKIYCVFHGSDGILHAGYDVSGWYDFIVSKKGTTYTWKYKLSSSTSWSTKTIELVDTYTSSLQELNIAKTSSYYMNYAQIDLNSFKFFDDKGNLVYQPCLKIPYTLSNTGLKITDKLDRAIDMSEWCGFSQYFGLDEQNGLCLVPQGDNITGRRELISRVEDSVTHYVTEIYSDLYCKQMGSGTASTAVTLNIPYKDEYYKLSVPQSAKSKTGFTPTASCDWTAEGYIYLDEVI